jgi:hypothetical protein
VVAIGSHQAGFNDGGVLLLDVMLSLGVETPAG